MKDRSKILNIASFSTQTRALGPGLRAVVWVQGCPFHCRGCIAPEWIPFQPAVQMTPRELVDRLLVADISGLTFSGGEPMEQAAGLAEVARLVKDRREVDIIS
ncbi:MAG TPA: 4Fe-4S single cluster domain-containing protein, partial [Anaerolineales bacterium]|nr:4Fe-4S single cluster domain-containing protein [Anaerolineales bacterium]